MFNNNLLMGAASAGGANLVSIDNSALFDASASTDGLSYTTDGSGFNQKTFTLSTWFYLGSSTASIGGVGWPIFASDHGSANSETTWWKVRINTNGTLVISNWNDVTTTQVFRDIGWYNLVIGADTTQVAAAERYRVYINGERITSFSSTGYPSQNIDLAWGEPSEDHWIGNYDNANYAYNGYLAETVFKSGSQLSPESFGEFDSTGTFWTPLSSTAILAGSPTFYLDNATNPQTDASGNGNNFTNNGSIATSTHTPTNIEFLMSPINVTDPSDNPVLSNGNRTYTASSAGAQTRMGGNIPFPSSGKWLQGVSMTDTNDGKAFAVWTDRTDGDGFPNFGGFLGWHLTSGLYGYTSSGSGIVTVSSFTASDQCWIAVDIDNSKVWLGFYDDSASTITWYAADGGTDGNPATGDNPFESIDCSGAVFAGAAQNSKAFTLVKEADCPFTIPTGYSFLSTTNLAANITRTHSNLEEYFSTTLYEGNGAGQRVGKFLPFTNTFTVGNSALFVNANSEDLSRGSMSGTATTFTISMWVKRTHPAVGSATANFMSTTASDAGLGFGNNSTADVLAWYSGSYTSTTRVFEDQSQWMNVVFKSSSGTGTAYVNGVEMLGSLTVNGADATMAIGSYNNASNFFDGYMAEVVMIDGTALEPSSFGQVDTSTGRWIPKDVSGLTFGTNGFYLNFAASDDVGNDVSGNNNDFTNNNTVVQASDTPTVNFATLDPNKMGSGLVPSNGNRTLNAKASSAWAVIYGTIPMRSGKWYWECHVLSAGADGVMYGVTNPNTAITHNTSAGDNYYNYSAYGTLYGPTAFKIGSWTTTTFTTGDKIGIAVDMDNGYIYFAKNNTWLMSSDPTTATGTGAAFSIGHEPILFPIVNQYLGYGTNVQFDSSLWSYSAPTGYLALSQDNMPEGESYQTAFSWIKNRDATDNNMLFDRVRGIYNDMHSNASSNQVTNVNTLQRFLNGGVQVGNDVEVNTASESYAAWNWYMETTGSGTSNTDGTINTTATLVDTNIGLSISQFTGTGSNATIGHGLGVVPQMYWVKGIDAGDHWYVYHANNTAAPQTDALLLNGTGATFDDATLWNDTAPTSSVISLGSNTGINQSSKKYLAMAFAPSQFTSIGSYKSNANANGPFVPTINSLGIPIQPAWVMVKDTSGASQWWIWDNQRSPFNLSTKVLYPNLSNAESTSVNISIDMVEGGFKLRTSSNPNGSSGNTYIYLAFGTPIIDVDGRIITGR